MESTMENVHEDSKQRWIYLDMLRVLSMFLFVVMSVASGKWGDLPVQTADWRILTVYNSLSKFCVPLFFMASGALMLNPAKELSIKEIITKHVVPLVTAFLFWSTAYTLLMYWLYTPEVFANFDIRAFISSVLQGDPNRHWFVFLIIRFYLIVPLIREIARNIRAIKFLILLWALFVLLNTSLSRIGLIAGNLPPAISETISEILTVSNRVKPSMLAEYVGYACLGYYIHVTGLTKKQGIYAAVTGLLAILYTAAMTMYLSAKTGTPDQTFFENMSINTCLIASSVMICVKVFMDKTWYKDATYKIVRYLSISAFGIFLIHAFLLRILSTYNINAMFIGSVFTTPVLSLAVAFVSSVIAYLIKKIPVVGDYLV